jgi:hypothetical protein
VIRDWLRRLGWGDNPQPSVSPPSATPPLAEGQYVTYYEERPDGRWTAFLIDVIAQRSDGMWGYEVRGKEASHETLLLLLHAPGKPASEYGLPMPGQGGMEVRRGTVSDQQGEPLFQAVRIGNLFGGSGPHGDRERMSHSPIVTQLPCGITKVYPSQFAIPFGPDRYVELNRRIPITGVARDSFAGAEKGGLVLTSLGSSGDPLLRSWDYVDLNHVQRCEYDGFSVAYPATWFLDPTHDSSLDRVVYGMRRGGGSCVVGMLVTIERHDGPEFEARHRELLEASGGDLGADKVPLKPLSRKVLDRSGGGQLFVAQKSDWQITWMEARAVLQSPTTHQVVLLQVLLCAANAHPDLTEMVSRIPTLAETIACSFEFRGTA